LDGASMGLSRDSDYDGRYAGIIRRRM